MPSNNRLPGGNSGYNGGYQEVPEVQYGDSKYEPPTDFEKFDPWKHMDLQKEGYTSPAVAIYGSRGSGKTHLLKHFLHTLQRKKHYDKAYLFSNTATLQPDAYSYIPSQHHYAGFKEDVVAKILEEQKLDVMSKRKNKQEKSIKRILMVFDDVINDPKVRHSDTLNRLYTQGRHLFISPIICTQEIGGAGGIPPTIRNNCDLILAFNAGNEYDRDLMTSRYLSLVNKKFGEHIYKGITNEVYSAIAVHFKGQSNARKYQDYVYKYRAPEKIPDFTIGKRLEDMEKNQKLAIAASKLPLGQVIKVKDGQQKIEAPMRRPQISIWG